jgi:hypothetical protein
MVPERGPAPAALQIHLGRHSGGCRTPNAEPQGKSAVTATVTTNLPSGHCDHERMVRRWHFVAAGVSVGVEG